MEDRCPQCGTERPAGEEWEQDLCPACLMKLGMSGVIPAIAIAEPEPAKTPATTTPARPSLRWRWAVVVAASVVMLALMTIVARHLTERAEPLQIVRMDIAAPPETELQDFAVSPDGRALAFTASAQERGTLLWIRRLDHQEPREIRGSEGASMPFWSPDSRSIGFFADGKVKTLRVDGDLPITAAVARRPRGASWSADNVILFGSVDAGLQRVPAYGGTAQRMAASSGPPLVYRWPQFLPDGRHFLVSAVGPRAAAGIHVGNIDSGATRLLVEGSSCAFYTDGRLLFVRDGVLMSQPMNAARVELSGEPVAVADSIDVRSASAPPVSAGGAILAYRVGDASGAHRLVWLDRSGRSADVATEPIEQEGFALSPDLRTIAVSRRTAPGGSDLWLLDLMRGVPTRSTFDARGVSSPIWSPDGSRVAFVSRTPEPEIRTIDVNASRESQSLLKWPNDTVLESWSPDQRFLVLTAGVQGKLETWMLPLEGDRRPSPLLKGEFNFSQAQVSPDGRWLAYVSDQSGSDEVYVRPFPPSSAPFAQMSINGGSQPRWSRDGRELFYVSPRLHMTSVRVEARYDVQAGTPEILFRAPASVERFSVANDGRFLVSMPSADQRRAQIHLVLNWTVGK